MPPFFARVATLVGAALALVLTACPGRRSPDDTSLPPTIRFALPPAGLPAPLEVPFPTDLSRTGPSGAITDQLTDWRHLGVTRNAETLTEAFADLDGFGRNGGALFRIDGTDEIDPASLPQDATSCTAPTSP